MRELVAGPGGLLSRGLIEDAAASYGALPRTKQERATLAGILNDYVRTNFPEYAKSHSGAGVGGVPGFWQELSGTVHIWKPRNYLMPLLVVPYKDANGLFQACQIRLHANDISSNEKRYCWLSSPQERHGTSSGAPIHFTFVNEITRSEIIRTKRAITRSSVIALERKQNASCDCGNQLLRFSCNKGLSSACRIFKSFLLSVVSVESTEIGTCALDQLTHSAICNKPYIRCALGTLTR